MLSARQIFEDNIRPSTLLLKVYRLLEHEKPDTEAEREATLRRLANASAEEETLVIFNEVFLGFIRERAEITRGSLRRGALGNLLRQSVVTACTALETYLPILLQNLDGVIRGVLSGT